MGTLTWIAWADATRFPHGFGEVAAVGPITATIVSPLLGWLIGWGGYPVVYGSLALVAAAALWFPVDFAYLPVVGRRVSDSRTNRLLLVAMFFLTTFGSAVFIFAGATAKALLGLSPLTVSLALSLNALTGVAATRFRARPRTAGAWLLGTAAGAYAVGTLPSITAFFLAMGLWGFAFWMGVPALFRLLAERSWTPSERVGDAQGMMALGRVFGPLIGGAAVGAGRYGRLSLVGALGLAFSSATVAAVEALRARR
jgi:DHA1 family inner membrane transport protein